MNSVLCLLELDGSGPDGSGPGGSGPDGSGPGGSGPDGSGPDGAQVADTSARALTFARSLAAAADLSLIAVAFGVPPGEPGADVLAGQLAGSGVDQLCLVTAAGLAGYAPAAWARALQQFAASGQAVAVVAAATDRGSEVLAHLGAMTGLPVAANCISAQPDSPGRWQLVRQRWAGSLLEDAVLEAPCALLTVAPDAPAPDAAGMDAVAPDAVGMDAVASDPVASDAAGMYGAVQHPVASGQLPPVRVFTPDLADADLLVRAVESAEQSSGMSLATARVVVGGGRGVGGPDGFAPLEELAALLGGVVGVSRVVTSQGWRPHRQQVGQTGTKISPELYLACGISGAIQHMAGCLSARHIVVVNTDPDAPIISHADYAVIGDLNEVIPALVAAIKAAGRT
jgi:electron transfer flavoprotein alpha subunit